MERQLAAATAAVERSTRNRNETIVAAFLAGAKYREIGRAAGLAHTAIKYIVEQADDPAVAARVELLRRLREEVRARNQQFAATRRAAEIDR